MKNFRLKVWHCSALMSYVFLANAVHFLWHHDNSIDCSIVQLVASIVWMVNAFFYYKID